VPEHFGESPVVGHSRHHPTAARHELGLLRGIEHRRRPLAGRGDDLRLRQPAAIRLVHPEAGGGHAQRLGHTLIEVLVELHA
jgi:hypothetical protein